MSALESNNPSYIRRFIESLLSILLTFPFPIVTLTYCSLPITAAMTFVLSATYLLAVWFVPDSFFAVVLILLLLAVSLLALPLVVGVRVWRSPTIGNRSQNLRGLLIAYIVSTVGTNMIHSLKYDFIASNLPDRSSTISLWTSVLLFQTFRIDNRASMPSLRKDEVVLGVHLRRPASAPIAPGDVVMVSLPTPSSPTTIFARRVVALGGSTVQMRHGILFIDGTPVQRERLTGSENLAAPDVGETGEAGQIWRETLPNGRSYSTLDLLENGPLDNTEEFKVPANEIFLLGDNRDNALDSRDRKRFGTATRERLLYRVVGIGWSSDLSRIGSINN